MHNENLHLWTHSHAFGQDKKRHGEVRTIIVIAITSVMMIIEIGAGIVFGSMALLADGMHMASHAIALSITAFAYIYARRHAHDERYSFGTGKFNALGGFTGAIFLVVFAFMMVWESVGRLIDPVDIAFNQAIFVAVLGLIVNGASVLILGHGDDHHHEHSHHTDHNLRSAYLHVFADALTSFLAIFALLAAKYFGLISMDPIMGILGAILVSRWALVLLRTTSSVLLDKQGPQKIRNTIKNSIEQHHDNRVTDLHLWSIGPSIYAVEVSIVTHDPKPPNYYKKLMPRDIGLKHLTVEIHQCSEDYECSL